MVKDIKFGLNDVFIAPASVSEINSRSECDIYNHDGVLPLFTAPMSSVVNLDNYKLFEENKITPIIPRSVSFIERLNLCHKNWCAFSLSEFEDVFNDTSQKLTVKNYVLIDIANGNMLKLHNTIKKGKEIHGEKLVIMAGNIANPETYRVLSDAGADYIRCGVGGGCFVGDMKVKTAKGLINIKDIILGDEVLTHTGEYNIVENVISYEIEEEIFEINNIKCTGNHEFYVIEENYQDLITENNYTDYAKWIKAKHLDVNKHLLIEL